MNTAYTTTQFCLHEATKCKVRVHVGYVLVDIKADTSTITLSGPPDVILTQLDAMRQEVGRVMAEAEGVAS